LMELFILVIVGFLVFKIISNLPTQDQKKEEPIDNYPQFKLRRSLMTPNERMFFETLRRIYGSTYDIYPQMHLGAIFQPIKNWNNWGELSRLNKRIDFLIVNRQFQTPVVGIELDDMSHSTNDKTIERDKFVEALFASSNIPLVRFKNGQYNQEDLIKRINLSR